MTALSSHLNHTHFSRGEPSKSLSRTIDRAVPQRAGSVNRPADAAKDRARSTASKGLESGLTRYEHILELTSDITRSPCLASVGEILAVHLDRISAISAWRWVYRNGSDAVIMDGFGRTATLSIHAFEQLSELERHWWNSEAPQLLHKEQLVRAKSFLALHLGLAHVQSLYVAPHRRAEEPRSLFLLGSRGEEFDPMAKPLIEFIAVLLQDKVQSLITAEGTGELLQAIVAEQIGMAPATVTAEPITADRRIPIGQPLRAVSTDHRGPSHDSTNERVSSTEHKNLAVSRSTSSGQKELVNRLGRGIRGSLIEVLDQVETLQHAELSPGQRYVAKSMRRHVYLLFDTIADLIDLTTIEANCLDAAEELTDMRTVNESEVDSRTNHRLAMAG